MASLAHEGNPAPEFSFTEAEIVAQLEIIDDRKGNCVGVGCAEDPPIDKECLCTDETVLNILSCNPDNYSLACDSDLRLVLGACGGTPPYTWSNTGDLLLSSIHGPQITVGVIPNLGPNVAGAAYWRAFVPCGACSGGVCTEPTVATIQIFGCDDNLQGCSSSSNCPAPAPSMLTCGCGLSCVPQCVDPVCFPGAVCEDMHNYTNLFSTYCDKRSAQMITDGCNPCGIQAGGTVTITDAEGFAASVVLKAK